ncbi:hypothetical protein LV84_03575 [Algoriphagus ratkowskyi]|uniref:PH (Pleckstrin Homology) domain-containing protein n=1 Tax=Algoriphagus ratkowskyi TaxID=57028 RepID=A0A2W7R7V0_9BACT|nr:hypothetical protein [Algoriphagus ratkowskyi]PZX51817.1 hypothetical protein LV84_03575 [Algoriphagus ratkowskyi]TXD76045.1 hypothetical protein ESW18_18290 [Algoriphagus ratkowskyi]
MVNRIFKESQSYVGTWVMYLIILIELPTLILLAILYATSEDKQEMIIAMAVVIGTMGLLILLILSLRLETRIDRQNISFRYKPIIRNWRNYSRAEILSAEVIEYSPLTDYGGWGLKGNKTTKAYSVLGDEGLLLDVGEKKKIMIGTMKSKELTDFMKDWIEK